MPIAVVAVFPAHGKAPAFGNSAASDGDTAAAGADVVVAVVAASDDDFIDSYDDCGDENALNPKP